MPDHQVDDSGTSSVTNSVASRQRRSMANFQGYGYDKGRPVVVQALWFAVMNLVFMKWWLPARFRPVLLRLFGAEVGAGTNIRHRVRVLWPWKLTIGDHAWIGEDVWLLNLEPITIGSDACLSQATSLITGSHDKRSPTFEYDNGPISVGDSAWLAFGSTVLRGVSVGPGAIVGAHSLVTKDVPADAMHRPDGTVSGPR